MSVRLTDSQPWLGPRDALVVVLPGLLAVAFGWWLIGETGGGRRWIGHLTTETDSGRKILLGLTALGAFGLLCLILSQVSQFSVRLLTGEWMLGWLRRPAVRRQERRRDGTQPRSTDYPPASAGAEPTRLGNILRGADFYVGDPQRFGVPMGLFWTHVHAKAEDALRAQLSAARAALEVRALLAVLALIASASTLVLTPFLRTPARIEAFLVVFLLLVGAGVLYRLTLGPARAYVALVRCTFDLHRREVLEAFGIRPPDTLLEERRAWQELSQLVHRRGLSSDPTTPYLAENP